MRTALSSTRLPPLLLPGAITGYLLLGLGNNSGLALAAMAVLVVGCALLWRPGEPPILLYIFGFQWLQAAIGIFHANLKGLTINELALQENAPGHTDLATMLCLIGLVLLAVGMRIGAGPQRLFDIRLASSVVARRPLLVWFKLLAVAWLIATLAQHLAPLLPGLSQPLLALANLQWAFFFIATYATFSRADASKTLWLIAFALELAGSLGGYFSSFRSVFLFTLIAILAAGVRLRPAQLLAVGAVFAVMVMLGVVWTAVKVEYRPYLSGGENTQTVTVGYLDRLEKMAQIASNLTGSDLSDAADRMIARIAYTNFFGSALDYVPQITPHENGALWLDAIVRPFMPRIFFPEKEAIDESALMNRYTGLGMAGIEQGTQITLGYMGESYVDFGEFGMMVPIFLFGLFLGGAYRWVTNHKNSRGVLGMGLAAAILMTADSLGASTAKLVGALVVQLLIAWLFLRLVVPRYLIWLRA